MREKFLEEEISKLRSDALKAEQRFAEEKRYLSYFKLLGRIQVWTSFAPRV